MIDRDKAIQLLEQSSLSNESGLWEGTTSEIQDLLNRVRNEALFEAAQKMSIELKCVGWVTVRGLAHQDAGKVLSFHETEPIAAQFKDLNMPAHMQKKKVYVFTGEPE